MHVERVVDLDRPVDEVFAYLADFEHTQEWDPGTISTRRVSGDGGPGTTWANVSEFAGRRTELLYEAVEHAPPTRLVFRGRNATATTTDTMTLTAAGAGTSLHYRADFSFRFPINLVAPLVLRRTLDALADETAASIRRTLAR